MSTTNTRAAMAVAAAVLLLAGCGGGGDVATQLTSTPAPSVTRSATSTPTPTATTSDEDLLASLESAWVAFDSEQQVDACRKTGDAESYASLMQLLLDMEVYTSAPLDQFLDEHCPQVKAATPTPKATPKPAPFVPNERAFVTALWSAYPDFKTQGRDKSVDFGWSICTLLEQGTLSYEQIRGGVHPNPRKGKAIMDAAVKYLCPEAG